jgi:hypothetical protein
MQGRVFSSNPLQRHFAATPETAGKGEGKEKQAVHWEVYQDSDGWLARRR